MKYLLLALALVACDNPVDPIIEHFEDPPTVTECTLVLPGDPIPGQPPAADTGWVCREVKP